ncbi:MAG TPA: ATP-binding cassette domain-containing protein, partial [Azospirillaceae bacterium]|nr:ATP-binding cassette domain-containing protein [Azospirillaceae bacterium]
EKSGRLVIEAKNLAKTFEAPDGPRLVLKDFSTRILRGDRIGFIGPNGAGKTTLLKILTGRLQPDSGAVRQGTELEIAEFDQRRADLPPEQTIRQVLCPYGGDSVMVGGKPRHVAGYIQDFLFDSRQLDTPVKALSGGERNRLILARLFARPSNVMILDEPTNDLDMDTLDLLQEVLSDYDGTLLLVSHDRDFLDRLATSTIVLEGDGKATEYAGGYSDYLSQRPPPAEAPAAAKSAAKPAAAAAQPKKAAKLSYKDQRELDDLPAKIAKLEAEIAKLEAAMADAGFYARDPAGFAKTSARLEAAQGELACAEERWLELEALKEALENGG